MDTFYTIVTSAALGTFASTIITMALQHRYSMRLERMRSELDSLKQSKDKARQVVAGAYTRLERIRTRLIEYVGTIVWNPPGALKDRACNLTKAHARFDELFNAKQVFVPPSLAEEMRQLSRRMFDLGMEFIGKYSRAEVDMEAHGQARKVLKVVLDDLPEEFKLLRMSVRRLLGSDEVMDGDKDE